MYIIKVNAKVEGVWREFYHYEITDENSDEVTNVYSEVLLSPNIRKVKVFFDLKEAIRVNALFESPFRKGTILDSKTRKPISLGENKVKVLRDLMEKYELFHQEDEVGVALKEVEEFCKNKLNYS